MTENPINSAKLLKAWLSASLRGAEFKAERHALADNAELLTVPVVRWP